MFVWHSKGTEESGAKIAEKLGCEHGTVPPRNYEGDVFCFGAAPAANFKWEDRKFGKIYNDPREVRNKKTPAELVGLGLPVANKVRVFCSGKKVLKIVDVETKNKITFGPAVVGDIYTRFLSKLGSPGLISLDGVYVGGVFQLTNVVYGPALLDHEDVISNVCETVGQDAKKELDTFVKAASPEEARAIMAVFKKMAKK